MIRHFQSKSVSQSQIWSIALLSLVMAGAVPTATQMGAMASTPNQSVMSTQVSQSPSNSRLPQRVVRQIRRDFTQRFQLSARNLRVVDFSRETWSDSCLGLAAPNERCATATVEGWRVEVTNGQQNWVFRTDLNAQVIRLETEDTASLPPQLVDRLFETIARQANVPANTLRVIESQPKTWDGCMGIFEPGQVCQMIALSGYRVIVMGDRQSWVYHMNQDGSTIVQNTTASGSGSEITPSFIPDQGEPSMPSEDVIFQMTIAGGLRGSKTETILTSNGTLYRRVTEMRTSGEPETTVIKRLSQRQLQQFQQVLEQQKFPNLNGMRYLTSAALADYPTTVVQGMGSTVAYIDLEQDNLPQSLQRVIEAWSRL
ncbi:hypothetical protein H6G89_19110 [Oscillatoria sp. FACHB-1407]|uniref:hypothetical protein n=1 Tax=Oscillatoria sp. FACHB-1407 TaxID=2692847 RepID=UPI0016880428|nr:hypothetical protein [Oscillatoria sp. FACHB-1407]MBD2463149.1 hypothetical protein [Oscillatoria sp. FACHB-1407]